MKTVDVYLKEALIHAVMGETPVINFNGGLKTIVLSLQFLHHLKK